MAEAVACAAPESPRNDAKGLPDPENMANAGPLPFPSPNLKARPHRGRLLRPDRTRKDRSSPRSSGSSSWTRGEEARFPPATSHPWWAFPGTRSTREWKKRFDREGPGGLVDHPRGTVKGSRLPDLTKRAILMLKESNPNYGCERISDLLARGPALQASATAVTKVLKEAGYVFDEIPTRSHPDHIREFERARPNQLWQTDLFTFILKRQNRRV